MSRTRTITIVFGSLAAGAMLATGVTGLAVAADSNPDAASASATPAAGVAGSGFADGMHHGPGVRMHGMGGGHHDEAVHGETVVKAEDGTFSTVQMIRGTVTAVSADSISVKAEDGFTATFAVTSDTEIRTGLPTRPAEGTQPTPPAAAAISDVAVGDVAMVSGTGEASAATADHVHAMTAAEAAQFEQDRTDREADHAA